MASNPTIGKNLIKVFTWWISQLNKLFLLLKEIPIFPYISLFDCFIALCIISVLISIIKFGVKTSNQSKWKNNIDNSFKTRRYR